jgi:hypothetical protein
MATRADKDRLTEPGEILDPSDRHIRPRWPHQRPTRRPDLRELRRKVSGEQVAVPRVVVKSQEVKHDMADREERAVGVPVSAVGAGAGRRSRSPFAADLHDSVRPRRRLKRSACDGDSAALWRSLVLEELRVVLPGYDAFGSGIVHCSVISVFAAQNDRTRWSSRVSVIGMSRNIIG